MNGLSQSLGIRWDRKQRLDPPPQQGVERAVKRFRKSLPQFVWEAAQLEGNPYTFPEVQTLLDGITVGGRRISDTRQILGLRDSMVLLCASVLDGSFRADRAFACKLNEMIARDESLEWGMFRGEGKERSNVSVNLGARSFSPKPTEAGAQNLIGCFEEGLGQLNKIDDAVERALLFKLFMCREQFFFDGNKRTARAMMNGILMVHGYDGISIPASKQLEYNRLMSDFYPSGDASQMMTFLWACFP